MEIKRRCPQRVFVVSLVNGELQGYIVTPEAAAQGCHESLTAMFTASYITVNVFPVILDAFRKTFGNPGGTFLIFMGTCLACSLFVWLTLPETKDKTLEEIGRFWLHLDNRRKSS